MCQAMRDRIILRTAYNYLPYYEKYGNTFIQNQQSEKAVYMWL